MKHRASFRTVKLFYNGGYITLFISQNYPIHGIALTLVYANLKNHLINNKFPLYSTGNYIQYPVINPNGKGYEKECMYMYN